MIDPLPTFPRRRPASLFMALLLMGLFFAAWLVISTSVSFSQKVLNPGLKLSPFLFPGLFFPKEKASGGLNAVQAIPRGLKKPRFL